MQFEDWISVIEDGAKGGFEGIQFIGGEPTLYPKLDLLIKFAQKEMNYKYIEIYTNLSRRLDWKYLATQNVAVATSFYSHEEKLHTEMTGNRNSFKNIIDNIRLILKSNMQFRVSLIVTDKNRTSVDETIKFLGDLGVQDVKIEEERKIGRANKSEKPTATELDQQLCGDCGRDKLVVNYDGDVFPCIMSTHRRIGNYLDKKNKPIELIKNLEEIPIISL